MNRQIAIPLSKLIDGYRKKANGAPIIHENLAPKPLRGFHQWADSKEWIPIPDEAA